MPIHISSLPLKGFNRVDKNEWFQIEQDESRPTRRNTEITEFRRISFFSLDFSLDIHKKLITH